MRQTSTTLALCALIIGLFLTITVSATQTDIAGPAGSGTFGATVTVLPNGNFVVTDLLYDLPGPIADVGAVHLYNGTTLALISTLTGGTANDNVGKGGITVLTNGNYVVQSNNWDNPSPVIADATAITFGNGTSGLITDGASGGNSVVGTVLNGTNTFSYDATRNRLFVGRSASNIVSFLSFNTNAIVDGTGSNPATWDNGLPNALVNGVIPNGRTVTLDSILNAGQITVECGGTLTGGSATAYVHGSIRKEYCAAVNETFLFPLGDADDYSPMQTANVNGTGRLIASVNDSLLPGLLAAHSASRFWTLSGTGITTDLSFTYTDGDVGGTETAYNVYRRFSGTTTQATPSTINTATNTATVTGISSFSDWGVGNLFPPTAASVSLSGRVLTNDGRGLRNAVVSLTKENGETIFTRTSSFGYYRFDEIEVGQTVILAVSSKRFQFAPQVVSLSDELTELDFVALPD